VGDPNIKPVSFSSSLGGFFGWKFFQNAQPQPPQPPQPPTPPTPQPAAPPTTPATPGDGSGFGSLFPRVGPSTSPNAPPATDQIGPSPGAPATDLGNLLQSSGAVETQKRSPIVNDPRIDGMHFGQIATWADGGYWFPARVDLDTATSKLNADNIQDMQVIKGPYSVRYGPGFAFLDITTLPTPRSQSGCFDAQGSTSIIYHTNGSGFSGQQTVSGGGTDWGFRASYDIMEAGNYRTGNGSVMPSSYNNQFYNLAYGMTLAPNVNVEMKYMHVGQNDVFLPGLLTNIQNLATDSFTTRLTATDGAYFDKFVADVWVNNTTFNGNSNSLNTRQQVPFLNNALPGLTAAVPGGQPIRLDLTTDGNTFTYGYREMMTWGDVKGFNVTAGTDLRVLQSQYNEYDSFNFSVFSPPPNFGLKPNPVNLGIPDARQIDPGLFVDTSVPIGEYLVFKSGVRVDFVSTQFLGFGPNADPGIYTGAVPTGGAPAYAGVPTDREWILPSGFLTGEYKITDHVTASAGYGYAQRAPTSTELYAGGAFLGLIQNGANAFYGNPNLDREQIHQFDIGIKAKYDCFRAGASGFYAFMPGYITYDNLGPFTVTATVPPAGPTQFRSSVVNDNFRFANTNMATMWGTSLFAEYDLLPWFTPFLSMNYTQGWDQTRDVALPGIAPLDSRVGFRIHEPGQTPKWAIEYYARIVDNQDLAAFNLGEQTTPGFVVHYIRAYYQPRENVMLLAGVDNIGNLEYREHLDLRTGNGTFQPGVNYYLGAKISY